MGRYAHFLISFARRWTSASLGLDFEEEGKGDNGSVTASSVSRSESDEESTSDALEGRGMGREAVGGRTKAALLAHSSACSWHLRSTASSIYTGMSSLSFKRSLNSLSASAAGSSSSSSSPSKGADAPETERGAEACS